MIGIKKLQAILNSLPPVGNTRVTDETLTYAHLSSFACEREWYILGYDGHDGLYALYDDEYSGVPQIRVFSLKELKKYSTVIFDETYQPLTVGALKEKVRSHDLFSKGKTHDDISVDEEPLI